MNYLHHTCLLRLAIVGPLEWRPVVRFLDVMLKSLIGYLRQSCIVYFAWEFWFRSKIVQFPWRPFLFAMIRFRVFSRRWFSTCFCSCCWTHGLITHSARASEKNSEFSVQITLKPSFYNICFMNSPELHCEEIEQTEQWWKVFRSFLLTSTSE